ncbi:hypothetical protein V8G54_012246 [Vigna mungo]|uniref:FBD domain-containing protein n=1 Tax=Vigna mungo TaxID=3915 RepID=A0AAQ3NSS3_VIGMU
MLKHCPKLQALSIYLYKLGEPKVDWPYPEFVPSCISSHLNTCSLENFGYLNDFRFARYIMHNARYLRAMKIKFYPFNKVGDKLNMKRDLSSCLKSSDTCTLSFK